MNLHTIRYSHTTCHSSVRGSIARLYAGLRCWVAQCFQAGPQRPLPAGWPSLTTTDHGGRIAAGDTLIGSPCSQRRVTLTDKLTGVAADFSPLPRPPRSPTSLSPSRPPAGKHQTNATCGRSESVVGLLRSDAIGCRRRYARLLSAVVGKPRLSSVIIGSTFTRDAGHMLENHERVHRQ